jgi:hypothetical protein
LEYSTDLLTPSTTLEAKSKMQSKNYSPVIYSHAIGGVSRFNGVETSYARYAPWLETRKAELGLSVKEKETNPAMPVWARACDCDLDWRCIALNLSEKASLKV